MLVSEFYPRLLKWSKKNPRPMPWSNLKDPYAIWISEIILQQTRVKQGWDYYVNFMESFPTVHVLAEAKEDDVLKAWEGLGYYSRARNIYKAAQIIVKENKGVFPKTYNEIIALPGIGPYTAAAISSFAYGLKHAVLDGNVLRVITRLLAIQDDILKTKTKKEIQQLLSQLMKEVNSSSEFNQAIMNFGAMMCTPHQPDCPQCPMQEFCLAYAEDLVSDIPVKLKRIKKKKRYFNYIDLVDLSANRIIYKRSENDIWKGLYEFLNFESKENKALSEQEILASLKGRNIEIVAGESKMIIHEYKRELTHQTIYARVYTIRCQEIISIPEDSILTNSPKQYAFPKLLELYLQTNLSL